MKMKIQNRPLRIAILVFTGSLAAIAIQFASAHIQKKSAERYDHLTRAGNCQTDVIAPFIQSHQLQHVRPGNAENFAVFVNQQVSNGSVSAAAAERVLTQIEKTQDGLPIHTQIGWVLPSLFQNKN